MTPRPLMRFLPVPLLALSAFPLATLAQSGGPWSVAWTTLDAGGGRATGGIWSVGITIAQPDAGRTQALPWTVAGGFWGSSLNAPPCPADLDDDGDLSTGLNPDGGTDINDFIFFLNHFENGC